MLFNSIDFVLFLPVAIGLYYLTPHRWRWVILLAASYVFYAWWRVEYLGLIILSTLIDYSAALMMGRYPERRGRRPFLIVSLIANLGLLVAFKYSGLFITTANAAVAWLGGEGSLSVLDVLLPVGISFYTFQTIAYSVDVYRGRIQPERHLGYFALYVCFWPQLVAGPIERASRLLPQFRERHRIDRALFTSGLQIMVWGFFLKVVVADRAAIFSDALFRAPEVHFGEATWVGLYFTAVHIYADFAGYSLIAVGTARMMGFRLMDNFRQPYFAPTMGELWRRWHISLTTWFRDYLYAPLRRGRLQLSVPATVFVVFAATGFWHGASWKFLLWGAIHGVYLIVEKRTEGWRNRVWAWLAQRADGVRPVAHAAGLSVPLPRIRYLLGVTWTFHAWILSGILFYVHKLSDYPVILAHMFSPGPGHTLLDVANQTPYYIAIAALSVGAFFAVDWIEKDMPLTEWLAQRTTATRWAIYTSVLLAIVMFGEFGHREFMYFQF